MRDPKLAIALAIHAGAIRLMVDHGEGSMSHDVAVDRSIKAFNGVMKEAEKMDGEDK